MSTQADVLRDSPGHVDVSATTTISPVQLFFWSLRREIWDNPSLYLAPAAIAVVVLLGFFFGPFGVNHFSHVTYMDSHGASHNGVSVTLPYDFASVLIQATTLLVSLFYSVDALYAERRDRSILFWKSLPVSDLITVLAKASVPLLVLPLISFAFAVATHLVMALVSSALLLRFGDPVAPLWSQLALPQIWLWLFGHVFAVAALWYTPFYGWLLLVSAWANRAPLLWALLPPMALSACEAIVFHTAHIGQALERRLAHGNITSDVLAKRASLLQLGDQAHHVASPYTPELWLGLAATVIFLALSVQLRRSRSPL